MKILSIQIGLPKKVQFRGREIETGIFKSPVAGRVRVGTTKIEGDGQADLKVHGGVDKAVYAYSLDSFEAWKNRRPGDHFEPGSFGENLSLDTMSETDVFIGDRFQVGSAILKAVQPRFPCYKLGVKFNDPSVVRDFLKVNRAGVYFSVEREGEFEAGDEFKFLGGEQKQISIARLFDVFHQNSVDPSELRTILNITSLPPSMRKQFEKLG